MIKLERTYTGYYFRSLFNEHDTQDYKEKILLGYMHNNSTYHIGLLGKICKLTPKPKQQLNTIKSDSNDANQCIMFQVLLQSLMLFNL